ncbi:unnamed protein product [Lampetra fluviatilis]
MVNQLNANALLPSPPGSVFFLSPAVASGPAECRILRCNSDFVASSTAAHTAWEQCAALRAYAHCTHATARACRGDLAYHSARHGIDDLMAQHNCSRDGPTAPTPPHGRNRVAADWGRADPGVCSYSPPEGERDIVYRHCGLFGDPHLRTFMDDFQTCKVEGAWPLVDNPYLSVQVTNIPVVPGSSATATNKLTIIFKEYAECTDVKMYQAETDSLPPAFVDGSKNGGPRDTTGSLRISELVPGRHVEIQARFIATTLVVRQIGRYLTFAVRAPAAVTASGIGDANGGGLQLCLNGCPTSERIRENDYRELLSRAEQRAQRSRAGGGGGGSFEPAGFTADFARAKCKERLHVEDLYFHSCVFDLLTTGDLNFTQAAYSAFEDVKTLSPDKDRIHIYRGTSDPTLGNAAPGRPRAVTGPVPLTLAILAIYCSVRASLL